MNNNYIKLLSCIMLSYGIQTHAQDDTPIEPEPQKSANSWLDTIPKTIDQIPTILPEESDHVTVPNIEETKAQSWVDEKQYSFSEKLQSYAHRMDDWFGEPDPDNPASANLRLILDNHWNKHDGYSIKPRVRGKVKLPTLEKKLSIVFGDDSLDNEIRGNTAISNENPQGNDDKTIDTRQSRTDNSSLALRWSQLENQWGVETDADLGIRSGDDIYVRLKGQKDWTLENDFSTHAEQIYRYGLDSKHYLRTNLEIRHARPNEAFLANQFALTYTDDDEQNFYWDNRLFRQHQFFNRQWFNYGIYTGGEIDNNTPDLNSYGPFIAWRQPILREWLFFQTEVNYYNDRKLDRDHHIGTLLRLETWF